LSDKLLTGSDGVGIDVYWDFEFIP